jgi:hypothetical protein
MPRISKARRITIDLEQWQPKHHNLCCVVVDVEGVKYHGPPLTREDGLTTARFLYRILDGLGEMPYLKIDAPEGDHHGNSK